jgi:hypothetical protein
MCCGTKYHADNQTTVNSPPKNDNQFVIFADGFPVFSMAIFPIYVYIKKIIPGICYRNSKINVNTEIGGGGGVELCFEYSNKNCIICVIGCR